MSNAKLMFAAMAAVCLLSLGSVATADYRSAVLALSPDHYWQLDETEVGTAVDAVGDIDGTHAGFFEMGEGEVGVPGPDAEISADIAPGNLAFNANNFASVDLGPGADLANTTMTYAGWFKENGSEGGDRLWTNNQTDGNVSFQIFFGGGFGEQAASLGIGLNPAVNGFPASGLPSGSGVGNFHIPDATVAVKDNMWHHIVASRNGNNIEDVIVVVDGVNYGPDTWRDSTDTWGTTGTNAQIATRTPGDGGGSLQALNGPTDEVAIWLGRQLTVEESIALYQAAVSTEVLGDYDGDGFVGQGDLDLVLLNWGDTIPPDPVPVGWVNEIPSGIIGQANLDGVLLNWGNGTAPVGAGSVPEPSTAILMLGLVAGLLGTRRR